MSLAPGPGTSAPPDAAAAAPPLRSPLPRSTSLLVLAGVVVVVAVAIGGVLLVRAVLPGVQRHPASVAVGLLTVMTVGFLGVIHAALRSAGATWVELGFRRPTLRLLHLCWQVPAMLVAVLVVQLVATLVRGTTPTDSGAVDDLFALVSPLEAVALFALVAGLTPLWEEAVFRGVVHGGLRRRWGIAPSVLLSATLFGLAHGVPALLPYLVTAGVSLALIAEHHRTLWASVIAHACINTLVTLPLLVGALST